MGYDYKCFICCKGFRFTKERNYELICCSWKCHDKVIFHNPPMEGKFDPEWARVKIDMWNNDKRFNPFTGKRITKTHVRVLAQVEKKIQHLQEWCRDDAFVRYESQNERVESARLEAEKIYEALKDRIYDEWNKLEEKRRLEAFEKSEQKRIEMEKLAPYADKVCKTCSNTVKFETESSYGDCGCSFPCGCHTTYEYATCETCKWRWDSNESSCHRPNMCGGMY